MHRERGSLLSGRKLRMPHGLLQPHLDVEPLESGLLGERHDARVHGGGLVGGESALLRSRPRGTLQGDQISGEVEGHDGILRGVALRLGRGRSARVLCAVAADVPLDEAAEFG